MVHATDEEIKERIQDNSLEKSLFREKLILALASNSMLVVVDSVMNTQTIFYNKTAKHIIKQADAIIKELEK